MQNEADRLPRLTSRPEANLAQPRATSLLPELASGEAQRGPPRSSAPPIVLHGQESCPLRRMTCA